MTIGEQFGEEEKLAAESLTPAQVFGITVGVLIFVCVIGFCFGRKWALWCFNRRGNRSNSRQPSGAEEAAPFSPAEQDML